MSNLLIVGDILANAKTWKTKIKKAAKAAGTWNDCFDGVVSILADIMERRDAALSQYEAMGAVPVVMHTNKAGADNLERNPALLIIADCEKTALQYWRDLGLTPAGLKKINDEALKERKVNSLEDILAKLEG